MQQAIDNQPVLISPPLESNRTVWASLYRDFAESQGVAQTDAMRDTVWQWLVDPDHSVEGVVVQSTEGEPIGLAHFREFACPLSAAEALFLDDFYIAPAARGSGIARLLLGTVVQIARGRGLPVVRLLCNEANFRARAFYEPVSVRLDQVIYDIPT